MITFGGRLMTVLPGGLLPALLLCARSEAAS
jgi:hypothetical protein